MCMANIHIYPHCFRGNVFAIGENISHAMICVFLGESCMCWKRISAVTCPSEYDVLDWTP